MTDSLSDIDIIGLLVDAHCQAHSPTRGFHYDARGIEHYSIALRRLGEAGLVKNLQEDTEPSGLVRVTSDRLPLERQVPRSSAAQAEEENLGLKDEISALRAALAEEKRRTIR